MSKELPAGIERILFTEEQIEARIREVASEISERYRGRTVKLVGVLKGSVFFLTALARQIEIPVKIDFLGISSFSSKAGAPGLVPGGTEGRGACPMSRGGISRDARKGSADPR